MSAGVSGRGWVVTALAGLCAACAGVPVSSPASCGPGDAGAPDRELALLRQQSFDNCPVPAHDVGARLIEPGAWPAHLATAQGPDHPLADWSVPPGASIVFVSAGDQASQGYRIEPRPPVRMIDQVLRVQVHLAAPPQGALVATALSSPCLYLLVQGQGASLRVDFGEADLPALAPERAQAR